jgi:hypothetical protein
MRTHGAGWLWLLVAAPPIVGQQLLWEQRGVMNVSSFGGSRGGIGTGSLASLGDCNGDGCDDLLTIGQEVPSAAHKLWLLSGADGNTLREIASAGQQRFYEAITGMGDVDDDGTPDYAVTIVDRSVGHIQPPRLVEVRSGGDDTVLWQISGRWTSEFGAAIAGDLDLDGDKLSDLVVIVPRAHGALNGGVDAYARDGKLLWRVLGNEALAVGMLPAVDRAGDVDGDGCEDVVVSAYHTDTGVAGGAVLSGRTGQVLVRGRSPPGILLGWDVAGCGDLDGDGIPDFAASASGLAMTFSGRDGKEIHRWGGLSMGDAIAGGLDLDRDGVPDVVVSDPSEDLGSNVSGAVYAFSGRDGSALLRVTNFDGSRFGSATFGFDAVVLRACAGNPFGALAFSHTTYMPYLGPTFGQEYLGRIFAWRVAPPGVQPFGASCAGTLARAPQIGMRRIGQGDPVIQLSEAPSGTSALLLLGLSSTTWVGQPLPLPIAGFPGCSLGVSIDAVVAKVTGTDGNNAGYTSFHLPLPLSGPLGVTLYGQWLVLGHGPTWPGGTTGALSWQH